MNTRYWIQEYNSAGNNWIDYVGFSPDADQIYTLKRLRDTAKAFPQRLFRAIERKDTVVATGRAFCTSSLAKKGASILDVA